MNRDLPQARDGAEAGAPAAYDAPRIETVLTPEELEREVEYAGGKGSPAPG